MTEPVHLTAEILDELRSDPTNASKYGYAKVVQALVERCDDTERGLDDTMAARDRAEKWADDLAYSISPVETIGEHSSGNNPWYNALHGETCEP